MCGCNGGNQNNRRSIQSNRARLVSSQGNRVAPQNVAAQAARDRILELRKQAMLRKFKKMN